MLRQATRAADWVVLRRTARRVPDRVGAIVDTLGRAASFGRLWLAAAVALALTGRSGRRAAADGLVAYGATVAISNGPVKWMTRRRRPSGLATLGLPVGGRVPKTSSFPSTHTAGGVAFAVAAGARMPGAVPVLGIAAASVGLARVHRVRHFPTDLLAGALLGGLVGTGAALVSRRREHARDSEQGSQGASNAHFGEAAARRAK